MMQRIPRIVALTLIMVLVLLVCVPVAAGGLLPGLKIFSGGDTITIPKEEYERLKRFERMSDIVDLVEKNYITEPNTQDMIHFAERTVLYPLDDPYTNYLSPEDMAVEEEERSGNYEGVGMQLTVDPTDNLITVTRVFQNSPAEKAGVLRGDKVVKVDGEEYYGNTMSQAVDVMRGQPGTDVTVSYLREGREELLDFTMTRAKVEVNNASYEILDGNIGYLLLYEFNGTDVDGFFRALDYFREHKVRGMILDLRDNPGGYVVDSVEIADALLPEGIITYMEDRQGRREEYKSNADMLGWPMVVLVNEYSASASEILTGAIRDYKVGKVVGTTTFGKGIVQEMFSFHADGAGLLLTTMYYFTPSGVCIHKIGIEPDVVVEQPENLRSQGPAVAHDLDVQLKRAIEVLEEEITQKGPAFVQ